MRVCVTCISIVLSWTSGTTSKGIKIVTFSSGNRTWLQGQGYTNVVMASTANLSSQLANADVFLPSWLGSNVADSTLNTIKTFVKDGGGLMMVEYGPGYGFWWNTDTPDIPGNRLLRDAGIGFCEKLSYWWDAEYYAWCGPDVCG